MPRTIVTNRPPAKAAPYGRKAAAKREPGGTPKSKSTGKGGFTCNKPALVSLVIKHSNPDWAEIASATQKSETKCKDIWRKVIQPALTANKPWSGGASGAWTSEERIKMVTMVLQYKPDWEVIAESFPGRTKTQVHDVWRKVIFPRLQRGETIE